MMTVSDDELTLSDHHSESVDVVTNGQVLFGSTRLLFEVACLRKILKMLTAPRRVASPVYWPLFPMRSFIVGLGFPLLSLTQSWNSSICNNMFTNLDSYCKPAWKNDVDSNDSSENCLDLPNRGEVRTILTSLWPSAVVRAMRETRRRRMMRNFHIWKRHRFGRQGRRGNLKDMPTRDFPGFI